MRIHIFNDEKSLIVAYADYIIEQVKQSIRSQGFCNIALAGGNSPKAVYTLLASPPFKSKLDWTKVFFFFGDERYVPSNDPQYNGLMVEKALFQPLHIRQSQIFKINTTLPPALAASQYMEVIKTHFKERPIEFDLIMLGLGDNAHTASLFPDTEVLREKKAGVKAVWLEQEKVYRISMTAPLINQARQIAFMIYGSNKAMAIKQVIEAERNIEQFPAQLINPVSGELHWFLDEAAATLLSTENLSHYE